MIVRYVGFLNEDSGYGQAARAHALALAESGVTVALHAITLSPAGPRELALDTARYPALAGLPKVDGRPDVEILHVTPPTLPHVRSPGAYAIALTVSETDALPPQWLPSLQAVDEIWTPSEHAAAAFRSTCAQPVQVVPHPVPIREAVRAPLPDIPDDVFLFLAVLEWQDRKNPEGLLRAFQTAFRGRRDVALLLKVGHLFVGRPQVVERALARLTRTLLPGLGPRVYVVQEPLSAASLHRLYCRADAFVSLHRAEAFGLCLAEAMAAGRATVATGYSGNLDYMTPEGAFLVDYDLVPVRERYARLHPYREGMRWAEPRLGAAVEALRQCAGDAGERARRAAYGRERARQLLAPARVGAHMKERLCCIR